MTCSAFVSFAEDSLPLVKLFSAGGTIATKWDEKAGGFGAALNGQDIVEAIPEVKRIARIEVEDILKVASADMTPEDWVTLAKRVNNTLADPAITGVVITQGTDTLEETAYFLDLTVTSRKPVVFVAAMRAATERDADGPRNLLNGVRIVLSPEATGKGVLVSLNGQIHAARNVTKTSTVVVETFRSPEFGQVGVADMDGKVRFYNDPLRRQTIPLTRDVKLPRVDIVLSYVGSDGRLVHRLLDEGGVDGLVIAGAGDGHMSASMEATVREAIDKGLVVAMSSKTGSGRIIPYYGANVRQIKMGIIQADNLNPVKTRVLLMLALTKTRDPAELQKYFDH
jgi:L-asparaginase